MADSGSLIAALLSSLLSLDVPPDLGAQVAELYRLQTALLRRRRLREMVERDRRRRQYLRRRRAFLLSSMAGILSLITVTRRPVWVINRSPAQNLWAGAQHFDEEEWKAQFRISRATFDFLLEEVGPAIKRRRTNFRAPIEPDRRLAIALWWFSRSGEYRTIAQMFGVGVATVCIVVRQVTAAILDRMYERYSLFTCCRRYSLFTCCRRYSLFTCCRRYSLFTCCRRYSLFTCCRRYSLFTCCRRYSLFNVSSLFQKSIMSDGVEIPVHLIGDESFPLKPWLMKGYSQHHQLSPEQRRFTYTLSSARSVVDTAFMRLKGRWRCLLKKTDIDVSMMPRVVAACCVLHNMCEQLGDCFLPEWNADANPTGGVGVPSMAASMLETLCQPNFQSTHRQAESWS
uniref:DDE Tnp4 domain-containing protein n=1 Tax=Labrus bergylta TaxID=56723 RepID=A0A3Q3LN85_9LABR